MGARIDIETLVVKNFAVTALGSADKEYHIMFPGKLAQIVYTVAHLAAYSVMCLQGGAWSEPGVYRCRYIAQSADGFGGLGIQLYRTVGGNLVYVGF